MMTADQLMLR